MEKGTTHQVFEGEEGNDEEEDEEDLELRQLHKGEDCFDAPRQERNPSLPWRILAVADVP